jgi:prenylcysteine oxidase/farnesylcysteine lyase
MINQIYTLYDADTPKWDSISNLSGVLGWSEITNTTTFQHLLNEGVSEKYIREVVEAATRVNYAQVNSFSMSSTLNHSSMFTECR